MPPPPQTTAGGGILQKMAMGAMMGSMVGIGIGGIFGAVSIARAGPGPRGTMATLTQYMLSSAATFGFFMSIGSVIRTESPYELPPAMRAQQLRNASPLATMAWRRRADVEVEVMPLP